MEDVKDVQKIIEIDEIRDKNFIAQNLWGPLLEKFHFYCSNQFSQISVIKIGIEVIKILKIIHGKE